MKILFHKNLASKNLFFGMKKVLILSTFFIGISFADAAPTASTLIGPDASIDPVDNKSARIKSQGMSGVDERTGAMTYSYEINIPQGRLGMTPKLALSYNSQNTESDWFGFGWGLSVPYIERTSKFGSDKLYTQPSFISSLHGEIVNVGGINYEEKVDDGSYAKYTFNSNTWKMVDRDGNTYYFGNTFESRVQDESGNKIGRWYLTEIRDKNGNGILYKYIKNQGSVYPLSVSYTENSSVQPMFLVSFNLDNRTDEVVSYKYGFKINQSKKVSNIKVSTEGVDNIYISFDYGLGTNSKRSMLSSIEEKRLGSNGDWMSIPKTTFEYENSPISLSGSVTGSVNPYGSNVVIDTNGDGFQDLYSTDSGYYPVDINGDFKKDLIQSDINYGTYSDGININYKLNQGGTFLLRQMASPSQPSYIRSLPNNTPVPPIRYVGENQWWWTQESAISDVNGDGFDDIINNNPYSGNGVAFNTTKNNFQYISGSPLSFVVAGENLYDMNGDGLQDKVSKNYTSTSTIFSVYLNNGTSFATNTDFIYDAKVASSTYDIGVRFVDINNDGLIDVVRSYNGAYTSNGSSCPTGYIQAPGVYPITQSVNTIDINTGKSFISSSSTLSGYLVSYYGCNWNSVYMYSSKEYDTNGDLTTDYDGLVNNTKKQDVLKKVNNSLGSSLEVGYVWSTKTGLNSSLPIPTYIVSTTTEKLTSSDTNPRVIGYHFYDGKMYFNELNPRDRKFAGFSKVEIVEGASKIVNYYHQGDGDDFSKGESGDSYYNIGNKYRSDVIDTSTTTPTIVKKEMFLYKTHNYASSTFTYLDSYVLNTYDKNQNFISTGVRNVYDESKRILKTNLNYGEIENFISFASSSISDKSLDYKKTEYSYTSTRPQRITKQEVFDILGNKISEKIYHYDNLPFGLVDRGSLTKNINNLYKSNGQLYSTSSTSFEYDQYGNLIKTTDALNNQTKFIYDAKLYLISSIDALNATTTYGYDSKTLFLKFKQGRDGVKDYQDLDGFGNVTRSYSMDNGGSITNEVLNRYVYGSGLVVYSTTKQSSSSEIRSLKVFDGFGRNTQTKNELSENVFLTNIKKYDNKGNLILSSLPFITTGYWPTFEQPTNGSEIYTYDQFDRIKRKDSFSYALYYDYDGRRVNIEDLTTNKYKKSVIYNASDRVYKVLEYNNGNTYQTEYAYTPNGDLSRIIDSEGGVRNFSYISDGSLIYQEDPHKPDDQTFVSYSYEYDALGRVSKRFSPNGVLEYFYDEIGRPISKNEYSQDFGTSTTNIYYTGCSSKSLPCSVVKDGATTTFSYDSFGRVSSETLQIDGETFTTSYTYDLIGNILTKTNPDRGVIRYSYSLDNKQDSVSYTTPEGVLKNIVDKVTTNQMGSLSSVKFSNGIYLCNSYAQESDEGVTYPRLSNYRYTLNSTGCLDTSSTTINLFKDNLTYRDQNSLGSIQSIYKDIKGDDYTRNVSFVYDNLKRITQVTSSYNNSNTIINSIEYSKTGNILKDGDLVYGYSVDGSQNVNAPTSIGGTHIGYDAQGNRINAGIEFYAWDVLNRLVSASSSKGLENYIYDYSGNRIKKTAKQNISLSQKVLATGTLAYVNSLKSNNLLESFSTSSLYISTSTYQILLSAGLLSKSSLYSLVSGYYFSPFISKFCSTANSVNSCIASTTYTLIADNVLSRSTSTHLTKGFLDETLGISTGKYLIPESYSGIASSSIISSDQTVFYIDSSILSSYNAYLSSGMVISPVEYYGLPFVSTTTSLVLSYSGVGDNLKVKTLMSLSGCNSIVTSCYDAKKVVFEKIYKDSGYLLSDKALEEMWYVYAGKARLPISASDFATSSAIVTISSYPSVTGISISSATSTYYEGLYFTSEYNNQKQKDPRLSYYNKIPYLISLGAFNELKSADISSTDLDSYRLVINNILNISLSSSTEYIHSLDNVIKKDRGVSLATSTLKEIYLIMTGGAVLPNSYNEYTDNSVFDLSGYLSLATYKKSYSDYSTLYSNTCHAGYVDGYGTANIHSRCVVSINQFSIPLATSSQVTYTLTLSPPPSVIETPLTVGESTNTSYPISNGYNYYNSESAIIFPNGLYATNTIDNLFLKQDIDVTSTVLKRLASSTAPERVLIITEREWVPGTVYPYDAQSVKLKAVSNEPRLTLTSTSLVSSIFLATSSVYFSDIENKINNYFLKIYDSSSLLSIATSSNVVISEETNLEFASTTLKDSNSISRIFLATSTPWCYDSASTTECDKQARKSFFKTIVSNLSGFTPSDAAVEEFWMVHKGILSLRDKNFSYTNATNSVPGYWRTLQPFESVPNGGATTTSGAYTIHTFTSSGSINVPFDLEAEVLVVGGGGNGGAGNSSYAGGGGGAGGVATSSSFILKAGSTNIVVGGAAASSSLGALLAPGGRSGQSAGPGGNSGNGYVGGATGQDNYQMSGGGAGSTGNGNPNVSFVAGNGGPGYTSSISGTSVCYAGGGGGANSGSGVCGGGNGGSMYSVGSNAAANSGSGGGGSSYFAGSVSSGGSGIVIIRYMMSTGTSTKIYIATSTESSISVFASSTYMGTAFSRSLFGGTLSTTTNSTTTIHHELIPTGLLDYLQYVSLYSTSSLATATSTKIVSEETYNELLFTTVRNNSDVKKIFTYALPYATTSCSGQSATSSCVVSALKTKVKSTIGSLSGFLVSDAAMQELYMVNNEELAIAPMSIVGSATSTELISSQINIDPLSVLSTFSTTTASTTTTSSQSGICAQGTLGATSSACYIDLPILNSSVQDIKVLLTLSDNSVSTSSLITSFAYVTGYASSSTSTPTFTTTFSTSSVNGIKIATSTFIYTLGSSFKTFLSSPSSKFIVSPSLSGTGLSYLSFSDPKFIVTRKIVVPKVSYSKTNYKQFSVFDRNTVYTLSTSTATTTANISDVPDLDLSTSFLPSAGVFVPTGSVSTSTGVSLSGLAAYYNLNNNSNDSYSSNNGTDTSISYSSGKIGNSASLNGSSFIDFGATPSYTDQMTISAWVKITGGSGYRQIINKESTGWGGEIDYEFGIEGSNKLWALVNTDNGATGIFSYLESSSLSTDVWHHVVLQTDYANDTVRMYVDGSQAATTSMGGRHVRNTNRNIMLGRQIGNQVYSGRFWTGNIDELAIWNRTLSSTEIGALYQNGSGLTYPFTVETQPAYDPNQIYLGNTLNVGYGSNQNQTIYSLPSLSFPHNPSPATSTLYTLSLSTTTQYSVYYPSNSYSKDTRGLSNTIITLNGTPVAYYSYATGSQPFSESLTYVLTNYQGTPVLETNQYGDIVQMDITDSYGNYVHRDNRQDTPEHDLGYTGHRYDDTTGLTYAKARYLDTETHGFLSPDPMIYKLPESYLLDPQQMNSYSYARNNPVMYTDPSGEMIQIPILMGVAIASYFALNDYPSTKSVVQDPQSTVTQKTIASALYLSNFTGLGATTQVGKQAVKQAVKSAESQVIKTELRNGAKVLSEEAKPKTIIHYTNEKGYNGIMESGKINPSTKAANPRDAYYGDGQYFSDIAPGSRTDRGLASIFTRVPTPNKYTHFIEISTDGLDVVQGRNGVFLIPNYEPLDIIERIVNYGKN